MYTINVPIFNVIEVYKDKPSSIDILNLYNFNIFFPIELDQIPTRYIFATTALTVCYRYNQLGFRCLIQTHGRFSLIILSIFWNTCSLISISINEV